MFEENRKMLALHENAEFGDTTEQHTLGMKYCLGRGVTKNRAQGTFWFRKAAEQGFNKSAVVSLVRYAREGSFSAHYHLAMLLKNREVFDIVLKKNPGKFLDTLMTDTLSDIESLCQAPAEGKTSFLLNDVLIQTLSTLPDTHPHYTRAQTLLHIFRDHVIAIIERLEQADEENEHQRRIKRRKLGKAYYQLCCIFEYSDPLAATKLLLRSADTRYLPALNRFNVRSSVTVNTEHHPVNIQNLDKEALLLRGVQALAYIGIPQDLHLAFFCIKSAAEQGCSASQNMLGTEYLIGGYFKKNREQGTHWIQQSAAGGNPTGQMNVGLMDRSQATQWFLKAADQEHCEAQYLLGCAHKKDPEQAFSWFLKAAELGQNEAQYSLALAYKEGNGTAQDFNVAFYWCRKSAKQGNKQAQKLLAHLYETGCGVEKDLDSATHWQAQSYQQKKSINLHIKKWYRAVEEIDNTPTATERGNLYLFGEGVVRNEVTAFCWFEEAAWQEDAYGQICLGRAYQVGWGIDINYRFAAYWFRQALEQNNNDKQTIGYLRECVKTGSVTARYHHAIAFKDTTLLEEDPHGFFGRIRDDKLLTPDTCLFWLQKLLEREVSRWHKFFASTPPDMDYRLYLIKYTYARLSQFGIGRNNVDTEKEETCVDLTKVKEANETITLLITALDTIPTHHLDHPEAQFILLHLNYMKFPAYQWEEDKINKWIPSQPIKIRISENETRLQQLTSHCLEGSKQRKAFLPSLGAYDPGFFKTTQRLNLLCDSQEITTQLRDDIIEDINSFRRTHELHQ